MTRTTRLLGIGLVIAVCATAGLAATVPAAATAPPDAVADARTGQSNDEFEPNDGMDTAASVDDGRYEFLQIVDGESDFFAVDLAAGQELSVELTFTDDDGDVDLSVYGPDRNELDYSVSVTDDERVTITAEQSGTHYVEAYGFSGASNDYNMTIASSFEPNDDFGDAATIDEGSHRPLALVDGESDFYAVSLSGGDTLTVDLSFTHDDGDVDLSVYDPDRNELDYSVSVTDGESVTVTAESAGTYYVEVYGFAGASNGYDMDVAVESAYDPDRFEPNDDFDAATAITEGSEADLTVVDGESDFYAVELTEGAELSVQLSFADADGDLDLAVYDPDENRLDNSVSVTDGESVTITADAAGTYYVEVYGFSGASNGYDMTIGVTGGASPTPTATATATATPSPTATATATATDGGSTPTATTGSTDVATDSPTATRAADEQGGDGGAGDGGDGSDGSSDGGDGDDGGITINVPGFGLPAALAALLSALVVARRR